MKNTLTSLAAKFFPIFFITVIYLFLFAPVAVLVLFSFNNASSLATWQGGSLQWYRALAQDLTILEALCNSLEIAFCATILSATLGTFIGLSPQKAFRKLPLIPIVLPDIVQGLSLLCFFIWLHVPLGKISVILAHSSFGAAYVSTMVRTRVRLIDPLLKDAAADLGAKPLRIFFQVTLPQLMPALISGMLIVFTLSFDDFSIAFFTAGIGAGTLPLKIYSMLKFGVTPVVNALSTVILCTSIALISLALLNQPKKAKGAGGAG